jgi:hypothetical protein
LIEEDVLAEDSEAVVAEAVAVFEVDETEHDQRCLIRLVQNVEMIVRFLSDLLESVLYIAVTVFEISILHLKDETMNEKNHEVEDEIEMTDVILKNVRCTRQSVLIVEMNVKFLSDQMVNVLYIAVIVLSRMIKIDQIHEKSMKAK